MMKQLACLLLFLLAGWNNLSAQHDISGNWTGAIEIPGMNLELSIHFQQNNGEWEGFMSIPVQRIKDMPLDELAFDKKHLSFKLSQVPGNASYSGDLDEKAEHFNGKFSQSGQIFTLNLARASAAEKAAEEKRLADAVSAFRHLADSLRAVLNVPGVSIGIIQEGKILLNEGFGYRDLEKKKPATNTTLFAIGSATKAFTTADLAILADQGQLDWEKPVIGYMPDFKLYDDFSTREMNAIDMTCHRSGLPRHDFIWYATDFNRQEIFSRLRYLKPNKSFRTTWQYNNLMFMTAGVLVERLSGKTWETFTRENILQPLGMNNSCFSVHDMEKSENAALGYLTKSGKNILMPYRVIDPMGPAGSINSNTTEMLKWVELHLNEGKSSGRQLISASEINRVHEPHMLMIDGHATPEISNPAYGLGWFTYHYRNLSVVEHGGNIDGFSALVFMVPEKQFGMVVLCNQNGSMLPTMLARYAVDMVYGLEPVDWNARMNKKDADGADGDQKDTKPKRVAGTHPSRALESFVGEFEHPAFGKVVVTETGGALHMKFNNIDLPLEHWHYDVFRAEDTLTDISFMLNFQTDATGMIYQVLIGLDPAVPDEVFTLTAPARLSDPAFLSSLAGKFQSEAHPEVTAELSVRNKTLYLKVTGQPEYTLTPYQGLIFNIKGLSGYQVEFMQNEKSAFDTIQFLQPNGIFKAKRIN